VVALPSTGQPVIQTAPGPCELAWIEECEQWGAKASPLVMEVGRSYAQIIDNDDLKPMHVQAGKSLEELRTKFDDGSHRRRVARGRLAAVRRISK
jgi:hypothetical protein